MDTHFETGFKNPLDEFPLIECDTPSNGEKVEEVDKRPILHQARQARKKRVLIALRRSLGIVSEACKMARFSRRTFYNYKANDAEFAEKAEELIEEEVDFVESVLLKRISEGDVRAVIYYLKTKGRSRGYF